MDVNLPQWLYVDPGPEMYLKESVEETPEMLVFGAELKCTQGTQNGFLMVLDDSICINGLPQANVGDRIISDNIVPFGVCQQGAPCKQIAQLQEEWINPNPQKNTVRGKEAITTESFLLCDRCGEISAVNSGQDGVEAAKIFSEWELFGEIEEKYPGLVDILLDPYGSLYLTEGMYQKALQFLGDCVAKNGGEIEIIHLGSPNTLEEILMNRALGHLVVEFDASTEVWRHDRMAQIGVDMGFEGVPGWNVDVLNEDMLGFLTEICEKRAEDVATNPNYRFNESTKELGANLYETANSAVFMYIASKYSMKAQQEKGVDFEEKGIADELKKTKQKLKEIADQIRKNSKVRNNKEIELFLPDEFYNKNLPSQVPPGVKYLPKYDEFGNVKQIKMYDDYGREIGWVDYTDHGYGNINSPDYHTVPHWHERIYDEFNRDGKKINHRTDTHTPLGDKR